MLLKMMEAATELRFEDRASAMARPLRESFVSIMAELARASSGKRGLLTGVHASIRSRLNRALETENPLASLYRMPGPEGLFQILQAASKEGASAKAVADAELRVRSYADFLTSEQINGDALRAILAGFLPEAHDDLVRSNYRADFRARSNIAGFYADTAVMTLFLYPGNDPRLCSAAVVGGYQGWRQLRADRMFAVTGYAIDDDHGTGDEKHTNLDGTPLAKLGEAPLLPEFCSTPLPRFNKVKIPHGYSFYLVNNDVGMRSACDIVFGEIFHNAEPRYRTDDKARTMQSLTFSTPARHLVFDIMVHEDIWPNAEPTLDFFNTTPSGQVDERTYDARLNDRIEIGAALRFLRPGLRGVETSHVPRYRDILNKVLDRIQVSAQSFRGYRCELDYPLYASQAVIMFELPEAPVT